MISQRVKLQDELVKFYQTYYSGSLMNGVIYSNKSLDELAKLAADTFPVFLIKTPKHQ